MRNRYLAMLSPLLAVAAFAVAPAAAQAAPHWYVGGARLPFTGAKTAVTTKGTLTLTDKQVASPAEVRVICKVTDSGHIWNTTFAAPGEDEINTFENRECVGEIVPGGRCEAAAATAEKLPWASKLTEVGGVIRDEVKGIQVKVALTNCPTIGTATLTYTGTLTPKFVNDTPSFAEFDAGSGHLTSSAPTEGTISGNDIVEGPSGAIVEAHNP